jgi:hypothetical protein
MKRSVQLLALGLVVFAACNHDKGDGGSDTGSAVQVPGKTGTASLTGTVAYHGAVPATPTRTATSDCAKLAGPAPAPLVVGKDGGVKDAFVWIKAGLPPGQYPVPTQPVTLDQKGCEYSPRVFGVRVGQTVALVNSDPILHNVHSPAFNVPLTSAGSRAERKFGKLQVMATVGCDVHPWMRAFAGVSPHPFFAVTDADGHFALRELPAGSYTVEVWQEKLGTTTMPVTIGDGEAKTLAVELKAP